jgi:uncharacterized protein YkwD
MPCVSPRLAPALGLAAASTMLAAIGALAISRGESPEPPSTIAGAVLSPAQAGSAAVSRSAPARTTSRPRPAHTTSSAAVEAVASPVPSAPSSLPRSAPDPAPPSSAPSSPAPQPVNAPAVQAEGDDSEGAAQAVFAAINRARAAQHLPLLSWDPRLSQSAHGHNRAMAAANTLSHQVAGELPLGSRETAAGVNWHYAAENIAWTSDQSTAGALEIEARMIAETPPSDAHRQNLLSTAATSVGVDVYFDSVHGRLWLTEDFAG